MQHYSFKISILFENDSNIISAPVSSNTTSIIILYNESYNFKVFFKNLSSLSIEKFIPVFIQLNESRATQASHDYKNINLSICVQSKIKKSKCLSVICLSLVVTVLPVQSYLAKSFCQDISDHQMKYRYEYKVIR